MSVEFRGTSKDTCNFYGKMEEEETASTTAGSSIATSNWRRNIGTGRYNTILIGVLIFLNVVMIALVIMNIATTTPDGKGESPVPQIAMLTSGSGMMQRLIDITKQNQNLTMNVQDTLDTDVIQILSSIRGIMGWKKSGNYFYKVMTDRQTYKTATSKCRAVGGRLATEILRDKTVVMQFIAGDFLNPMDVNLQYWVGINDMNTEGEWRWVDGGKTNNATIRWWPGEPNQYRGEEDCGNIKGHMDNTILLNDAPCSTYYPYICEVQTQKPM